MFSTRGSRASTAPYGNCIASGDFKSSRNIGLRHPILRSDTNKHGLLNRIRSQNCLTQLSEYPFRPGLVCELTTLLRFAVSDEQELEKVLAQDGADSDEAARV